MKKTRNLIPIISSFIILILLSFIFGKYDLQIFLKYGNIQSSFGLTMEILGELVAPLLFTLSGSIMFIHYKSIKDTNIRNYKKFITFSLICIIVGLLYSAFVLTTRGLNIFVSICFIIFIGVFYAIMFSIFKKIDSDKLNFIFKIAITTIIYCLAVLVVINIFKIFWGRVRPRHLVNDLTKFSPFYLPQGINGNRSFPSGHTSNATILYVITMFAPVLKRKLSKILIYSFPVLWIIIMAYSRVICGAHFASDVLYGATISIITFYITKHYINNSFLKKLN